MSAHEFAMRAPFQLGCMHYSHKLLLTNTVLAMFCHHFCPPASWASNPLEPSIHIIYNIAKWSTGKKTICHPDFSQSRCHVLQAVFRTQNRFSRRPWVSQLLTMGSASTKKHAWQILSKSTKNFRKICWCGTIGYVFLDQNVCQQSSSAGNGRLRFQQGNGP